MALAAAALGTAATALATSDAAAADGDPLLVGGFRTAKTRTSIVYEGGLGNGTLGYGFGVTDGALASFPFAAAIAATPARTSARESTATPARTRSR